MKKLFKIIIAALFLLQATNVYALPVYLPVQGGTGISSYTAGDLIYASTTNLLVKRGIGSNGSVLSVVSGFPNWVATSTLGLSAIWGTITGTLSNQTDLQSALDAKLSTTSAAATYVPLTRTLNGLAWSSNQTFATSTTGTDFNIVSSGTTHTFNLPTASASNRGALSSTDWTTFNNKQAAGNYITALTGDVTASGPGSVAATLATVNSNVGSFGSTVSIPSFTVNAKGLITTASGNSVTIPTAVGTSTQVAYFNGVNSLTSDANFTWASTTGKRYMRSTQYTGSVVSVDNVTVNNSATSNADVQIYGVDQSSAMGTVNGYMGGGTNNFGGYFNMRGPSSTNFSVPTLVMGTRGGYAILKLTAGESSYNTDAFIQTGYHGALDLYSNYYNDGSSGQLIDTSKPSWYAELNGNGDHFAIGRAVANSTSFTTFMETTANGATTFTPRTSSDVPLTSKGVSSQSGDLFQNKDSSANVLSRFNKDGWLGVGAGASTVSYPIFLSINQNNNTELRVSNGQGGNSSYSTVNVYADTSNAVVQVLSSTFSTSGIAIANGAYFGANSSSGTFFGNSHASGYLSLYTAGSNRARILSTGEFLVNATASISSTFGIVPLSASTVGLVVKGASSQSADLREEQNSSGTVLNSTDSAGDMYMRNGASVLSKWGVVTRGSNHDTVFGSWSNNNVLFYQNQGEAWRINASTDLPLMRGKSTASVSTKSGAFIDIYKSNGDGGYNTENASQTLTQTPFFSMQRAYISGGTKGAVLNGYYLGELQFEGHNGTTYAKGGSVRAEATGTWSSTSYPTKLVLGAAKANATSTTDTVQINGLNLQTLSGTSTVYANVGGTIFDHYADVGNVGTGEDNLYSDTVATSTLATNGDKITGTYQGIFVGAAASTQELKIYFGGTMIYDSGALSIGAATDNWTAHTLCIRVSSSVVRCSVSIATDFGTLFPYSKYTEVTGLTLSSPQIVKVTGEAAGVGAADNQIVAKLGTLSWFPAAN